MNKCVATYGELMGMLDKELSGVHFLIQILPGADFDLTIHSLRDDLQPLKTHAETYAKMVNDGLIQIVYPDEARRYHASSLMLIDGCRQSYAMPITNRSLCRIEAHGAAVFFQVLDGDDN